MLAFDSGQAPLRHTRGPAESCFLPDLTRFTGSRCAGPDPQRLVRVVPLGGPSLEREFSPPDVGLGYRAPRAPRLARSTREATRRRVPSRPLEGCESGRIGTLGKRVWGNSPWVRIPLPPPVARFTTFSLVSVPSGCPVSGRANESLSTPFDALRGRRPRSARRGVCRRQVSPAVPATPRHFAQQRRQTSRRLVDEWSSASKPIPRPRFHRARPAIAFEHERGGTYGSHR